MFLDDSVADTQPEAGSLAHRLGGVEGIENPAWILDSRTAVVEFHAHERILLEHAHFQHATAAALHHRIKRVVDHIQEDLLQLMGIGYH